MIEPSSLELSSLEPSERDKRRLVRGVKFGVIGALLFVLSLLLVVVLLELASPFIERGAEAIFGSEIVQDAEWYVTNSAIYEKLVGMI